MYVIKQALRDNNLTNIKSNARYIVWQRQLYYKLQSTDVVRIPTWKMGLSLFGLSVTLNKNNTPRMQQVCTAVAFYVQHGKFYTACDIVRKPVAYGRSSEAGLNIILITSTVGSERQWNQVGRNSLRCRRRYTALRPMLYNTYDEMCTERALANHHRI